MEESILTQDREKTIYRVFFCVIILAVVLLLAQNIPRLIVPYVMGDEFGYLANAAYFGGHNWAYQLGENMAYFSFGYPLLLAPFYWVFKQGKTIYAAVVVFNILLLLLSIFVNFQIVKTLFRDRDSYHNKLFFVPVLIAFVSFGNILYHSHALPEVLSNLLVSTVVLFAIKVIQTSSLKWILLCTLTAVYTYWVHQRYIAIIIALFLLFVFLTLLRAGENTVQNTAYPQLMFKVTSCLESETRIKMMKPSHLFLVGVIFLTGIFLNELIKESLMQNLYYNLTAYRQQVNNYGGVLNRLLAVDIDYLYRFFTMVLGQLYTLGLSTFFLGYYFIYDAIKTLLSAVKTKMFCELDVLKIFLLTAYIGIALVTVLFFVESNSPRVDLLFYERHVKGINLIIFLVSFICFFMKYAKDKKKIIRFFVVTGILNTAIILIIGSYTYISDYSMLNSFTTPSLLSMFFLAENSFNLVIFVLFPLLKASLMLFLFLIFEKKLVPLLLVLPMLIASFYNENTYTKRFVFRTTAYYSAAAEYSKSIPKTNRVYCVVPNDVDYSNATKRLQTLFISFPVQEIHEDDLETIAFEEGDFILDSVEVLENNTQVGQDLFLGLWPNPDSLNNSYVVEYREDLSGQVPSENEMLMYDNLTAEDGALIFSEDSMLQYAETADETQPIAYGFNIYINEDQGNLEDSISIAHKWEQWGAKHTFGFLQSNTHYGFSFSSDGINSESVWVDQSAIPRDTWNAVEVHFDGGDVVITNNDDVIAEKTLSFETLYESDLPIILGENFRGKIKDFYYVNQ